MSGRNGGVQCQDGRTLNANMLTVLASSKPSNRYHAPMTTRRLVPLCKAASVGVLLLGLSHSTALGEWQRDDRSLAWVSGTNVFWRFSLDPGKGKPFFHPLAPGGKTPLTNFRPADHPWRYALWFSWKDIDHPDDARHVNDWKENSADHAQGNTRWDSPTIKTQPDERATIHLRLHYYH